MNPWLASFTAARSDLEACTPANGEKRTESSRLTCLFRSLVPRGPVLSTYESLFQAPRQNRMQRQLNSTASTADDLIRWLQCPQLSKSSLSLCGIQEILFIIVKGDCWEVLNLIESALSDIGHKMLDDSMLYGNLRHWRYLIERSGMELHRLSDSLTQFAGSLPISTPVTWGIDDSCVPLSQSVSLSDLMTRISKLEKLTIKTHKSLMANVSIMESKRGIAESENITKITELSFVFIPLTFSASVFSMQVKELKDAHVSVLTFLLLAFGLIIALYGLRLLTRSTSTTALKELCIAQVRATSRLQHGASIPTRAYAVWVWRNVGLLFLFIGIMISPIVPGIVFLWKRVHNNHLDAFLTMVTFFDVLVAAWFLGNVLFYSDNCGLRLRYSLFPFKEIKTSELAFSSTSINSQLKPRTVGSRKTLQFVALTNLICLPLGFLWAQSLSIVPKLVITVIMLLVVSFPVYIFPICSARPSLEECEAMRESLGLEIQRPTSHTAYRGIAYVLPSGA